MSICPICGKEFDPKAHSKKPRRYCSAECYRRANIQSTNLHLKERRNASRMAWANAEAVQLINALEEQGVDGLASYVYNHYKPKNRKS